PHPGPHRLAAPAAGQARGLSGGLSAPPIRATIDPMADTHEIPEIPEIPEAERESAYALLQRGQALIRSRHHAQAAIVLERAARVEPGKGSILEPLGRAYHHSGQFDRARET